MVTASNVGCSNNVRQAGSSSEVSVKSILASLRRLISTKGCDGFRRHVIMASNAICFSSSVIVISLKWTRAAERGVPGVGWVITFKGAGCEEPSEGDKQVSFIRMDGITLLTFPPPIFPQFYTLKTPTIIEKAMALGRCVLRYRNEMMGVSGFGERPLAIPEHECQCLKCIRATCALLKRDVGLFMFQYKRHENQLQTYRIPLIIQVAAPRLITNLTLSRLLFQGSVKPCSDDCNLLFFRGQFEC